MIISRYKIGKKPMTFAVKKLDMKNSVNEYEIRNPPRLHTGKVFRLKREEKRFFQDIRNTPGKNVGGSRYLKTLHP